MKITKILMLLAAFAAFSCSKDDDAEPAKQNLEEVKFGFSSQTTVVQVPTAMASSQNEMAQLATTYLGMANAMTSYSSYLTPPAGAVKSTTQISVGNGRTQSGEVVNYTWETQGFGYAYQISEQSDSYHFEVFIKYNGSTTWSKFFDIVEKKDKSAGTMKVYMDSSNGDESDLMYTFTWLKSGDNLTMTIDSFDTSIEMNVNTKTGAGSMISYIEDVKTYQMTWDAQGKGSYKYFNEDGTIADEGTW